MKQKVLALMAAAVFGITSLPMAGVNVFAEEKTEQPSIHITENDENLNVVNEAVTGASITFNEATPIVLNGVGSSHRISIDVEYSGDKSVSWTSSNPSDIPVDQNGTVTANKANSKATITVTLKAEPSIFTSCEVSVTADGTVPPTEPGKTELKPSKPGTKELPPAKIDGRPIRGHHWGWYGPDYWWYYDKPDFKPDYKPDYKPDRKPDAAPPKKSETVSVPAATKPAVRPTTNKGVGRFYNPKTGEHIYTTSGAEARSLYDAGWKHEGTAWISPATGEPVYRLYNPKNGDHMLTISSVERDTLIAHGWNYESIAFQSGGSTPVFRLFNPDAAKGKHAFTTSSSERDRMMANGWISEGIGWYAVK